MSKKFLTWTLILAFATCHSPAFIRADSSADNYQESVAAPEQTVEPTSQTEQPASTPDTSTQEESENEEDPNGTPVNPTNPSTHKSANRQFWTNLLIAGVVVFVAIVSICVVSNNNGKKK
ncbi:MAG: hypothetical protein V4489_03985 [Chlamydiota bacterium]